MHPFQALTLLPQLVADYQKTAADLMAAQRELQAIKEDRYVTYEWVCAFFGLDKKTVRQMLANERVFVHGKKVKRFLRSDIIRFAQAHSIEVKYLK